MTSPSKKIATPRRPRQTKAQKEAAAASTSAANAALHDALASAADAADAVEPKLEDVKEEAEETDKVKVTVDSTVDVNGDGVETTHTNVSVEMPVGLPELPLPEDTEAMIAKAKEMVEEANKLQSEQVDSTEVAAPSKKSKRKADEITKDEEADANGNIDGELPEQPAKKAKVLESRLKREKVRNRATFGIAATLAIA